MVDAFEKGMKLHAKYWDEFYPAEVVEVSWSKKFAKTPVKVCFVGFDDAQWMAIGDLKSKKTKKAKAAPKAASKAAAKTPAGTDYSGLAKGMRIQAEYGGTYYAAEVLTVSTATAKAKAPVKVSFVGYEGLDEWLGADRIRSKALKAKAAEPAAAKAGDDYSGLTKGMRVQAEFGGTYYAADVLTVSTAKAKAKAPVKVSFVGYAGMDEWVGADRLRSKALQKAAPAKEPAKAKGAAKAAAAPAAKKYDYSGLEKGMRLQAEYEGVYYAAEVVTVSNANAKAKAPVKVQFVGYEGMSEWLGGDKIRSKALKAATQEPAKAAAPKAAAYDFSKLEKGMKIQAESDGAYYAAEVVTVSKAKAKAKPVKIHFVGYTPESDEWVGGDRIRSKALGKPKAAKKA
jgi:hypothetical protein